MPPQGRGGMESGSPCWARTNNPAVNSRVLYHSSKNVSLKRETFLMLALPIFPDRRQSGIVGRDELNCRVRNGNGWTLILINTNCIIRHNPETVLHYIRFVLLCQAFFSISGKKFFSSPGNHSFSQHQSFSHCNTFHMEVFLTAGTQPEITFSSQ